MIVSSPDWLKLKSSLSDAKMWLFFATANFALWHGVLNYRVESNDPITTAFFWLVALFLLWKKRDQITISSQPLISIIGFLLLGWVLYRGLSVFWFENSLVQLLPLAGFFALALLTSGGKRLSLYIRPFLALLIFSVVGSVVELFFKSQPGSLNFAQLTAQASAFLLHYLGFDVAREGAYIFLTQGSVEVLYFCTGGPLIALLFQLTLVLMLIIPLPWKLLSKLLFGIVSMGFFLGIIRVALLAVVVSDQAAFDYWHGSEGNQIFSLIAFSIWIIAAHFISENSDSRLAFTGQENQETKQDQTFFQQETSSQLSLHSPGTWLLPLTSLAMAGITIATLLMPQVGRREIKSLQFPSQVTLSGWEEQNSVSLVDNPETGLQLHRLRSGQKYHYQQQGTEVTAALRFFSPTFGNIEHYVKKTDDPPLQKAYAQGKTSYLPDLGTYRLFNDQETAYLSACLTPEGESTINVAAYVNKTNRGIFNWETLIPRLLGQRSLRERRCLWVHLSTPLQQDSPEDSYRRLESVFKTGYSQWQGLFEQRSRLEL